MEAVGANEPHKDTLIDGGIIWLVLVWAMVDTGAEVEQEVVDARRTLVNLSIARCTGLLALPAHLIDWCLPLLAIALPLASAVSVEHKAFSALGASINVAHTCDAILMAGLAKAALRYVYLLVCLAYL